MAAGREIQVHREFISADDAAGRVHQHMVADAGAFGVQALQHTQGAVVAVQRERRIALAAVGDPQFTLPA
jgi:hypothetical protein